MYLSTQLAYLKKVTGMVEDDSSLSSDDMSFASTHS